MKSEKLNRILAVASTGLLALMLTPTIGAAQQLEDIKSSPPLTLRSQGSFYVDGSTVFVDAPYLAGSSSAGRPGNFMTNQMYVQFQKPVKTTAPYPIVFVHGCCLSGKTWETTPDGRMGWGEYFVRKGYDTYLVDQPGRGRSGFNPLQFAKVRVGDAPPNTTPNLLIGTDAFGWNTFRWGNYATRTPYPDERFPMKSVGVGPGSTLSFLSQVIADPTSTLPNVPAGCAGSGCIPPDPAAYWNAPAQMADLANRLGGAILVGHSQSSPYPTRAALQQGSTKVKGIIQLETGCFTNLTAAHIAILKKIPILIMEGDHYVQADGVTPQVKPPAACVTMMQQINGVGGDMTYIHLPALGIKGNSHMFMQDNNNLQVADIVMKWIDKHVKSKNGGHDHDDDHDDHDHDDHDHDDHGHHN
jgi:pimeloyl-ACP methyl ester carboxylesterase